jgi:hypothetical protein
MDLVSVVEEFNGLIIQLLSRLPKVVPQHALLLQGSILNVHQIIKKNPQKLLADFSAKFKKFRQEYKGDAANIEENFLFEEGKNIVSFNVKAEWDKMSVVSKSSLLLYMKKLILLQDLFDMEFAKNDVDIKGEVFPMMKAVLTGDYSEISEEAKTILNNIKSTVENAEKERGKPFDIKDAQSLRELQQVIDKNRDKLAAKPSEENENL